MTAFRDAFIEYEPAVVLPPITVSSEAVLESPAVALSQLAVTNHATFPYGVRITGGPDWLLGPAEPEPLAPGESTTLRLAVDPSTAPPGETAASARVTISAPFLRRSYPFAVQASVRYTGPAPRIESETTAEPDGRRTLHLTIANAGGGLLQGFCYDRGTNARREFLLAGAEEEREAQVLRFSTTIADEHSGVVVVCDCINERLRRQELFADRAAPFVDAPFIDFLATPPRESRSFELRLRGLQNPAIEVPNALRGFLTFERVPPDCIRFVLASAQRRPSQLADTVTFRHAGAVRSIPILISEPVEELA